MTHDPLQDCEFRTERLVVGDWHELSDRFGLDLVDVVRCVLTPTTTSQLPPPWRGDYDDERATDWIDDRDHESPTLLIIDHRTGRAVGVLILFASQSDASIGKMEVRLGYVIAESAWGRGIATELVGALVAWGRAQPTVGAMAAGVGDGHDASASVLLKNGFRHVGVQGGDRVFRRSVDT